MTIKEGTIYKIWSVLKMIICRKRVACNAVRRNIQRIYQYDVVVAGSGPAGVCATVSAARQGTKLSARKLIHARSMKQSLLPLN